jgi:hypothetical protein
MLECRLLGPCETAVSLPAASKIHDFEGYSRTLRQRVHLTSPATGRIDASHLTGTTEGDRTMPQSTVTKYLKLMMLVLLGSTVIAGAAEIELTPFYGYTFGGDFDDLPNSTELEIDDGESFGLTLGFMTSPTTQIELLWNRQETDLNVSVGNVAGPTFGLTVDQYHIGGLYLPTSMNDAVQPFVSFSLGVTVFDPSGRSSEDKFSVSLGGGVKYALGERLGLRLQARWTPTYVNSTADGVFCDPFGFCYVLEDSNYVHQFDASVGLIIKF